MEDHCNALQSMRQLRELNHHLEVSKPSIWPFKAVGHSTFNGSTFPILKLLLETLVKTKKKEIDNMVFLSSRLAL